MPPIASFCDFSRYHPWKLIQQNFKLIAKTRKLILRNLQVLDQSTAKVSARETFCPEVIKSAGRHLWWNQFLIKQQEKFLNFTGILLEIVQEKLWYVVFYSKLQAFRLQPPVLTWMFLKFWKIPDDVCCGVHFYRSRH